MSPFAGWAEEPVELTTRQFSLPRPAGKQSGEPLPRSVLFVQAAERGETIDEPSTTSFYVYDPANAQAGLRKVFGGPSEDQYCRFITPLLDGWGVAVGQLDPQKRPQGRGACSGSICSPERSARRFPGELGRKDCSATRSSSWPAHCPTPQRERLCNHVNRYDFAKGQLTHCGMGFTYFSPLGKRALLALDSGQRIVKIDLAKGEAETLGELPKGPAHALGEQPKTGLPTLHLDGATGIYPAGPGCRDGVYCICDFSLYFKPLKEDWHTVIESVNIVKTFGGVSPWLPVAYVGQGRFAVAKTTKYPVELPAEKKKELVYGEPGLAVTRLIDGRTGKVLKESAPQLYNHNPPLDIADDWWSADVKPAPQGPDREERKSSFQSQDAGKTIRYAGDKQISLADNEVATESGDGRFLAVYPRFIESKTSTPKLTFRIVNGRTGTIAGHAATAKSKEIYVLMAAWQVLCSATPDQATLDSFRSSGFDFLQEPMGNW